MAASTQEYAETVGGRWWLWAVLGVLGIAAGVLAIAYPDVTLSIVGLIFGIYLLLYGTILFLAAFDPYVDGMHAALRAILGVVGVIAGIVVLVQPSENVALLVFIIALYFVIAGAITVLEGIVNQDGHWITKIVLGLVGIAAGVILLANPDMGLNALALVAGISLCAWGVLEILASLDIRRLRNA